SGGLDSRTLAVAMQNIGRQPYTYSYRFEGSFEETYYGREMAKALGWAFEELVIPPGYLWNKIEDAGKVNGCYAEFTHARQVAVAEQLSNNGDIWLLGHWGDVLFDDMGVHSDESFASQVDILYKKVLKKGGKELAADLWQAWGLDGDFEARLAQRISTMHERINISDANARVRAFKSLYWATRWTSTNLNYFSAHKPIALPYYDDRMCTFIMGIPEKHLAARQIQLEYIKKYSPELAKVAWQAKAPYNLYTANKHLTMAHLPYRVVNKAKRIINEKLFDKQLVQRNWEIQFLGAENNQQLRYWLFENPAFAELVPKEVAVKYYNLFQRGDKVYWSHPLSILVTLSVFAKQHHFQVP
ncbi:MAG: asparagine synthetase B family protein, partial [Schleiferiaceae bacterium]|nr:asparagine synthetase B family protein [Schleiferiaceae bacterium]